TRIQVKVRYADDSLPNDKITLTINTPTGGYQSFNSLSADLSATLQGTPLKIKIQLRNKGTSGKVRYDVLSLSWNEGTLTLPHFGGQ
ncbi:MAG TPA: hypothetical protein VHL11_24845, partial [Phototrophicaceae bacterium]|nr:hypothetical protein [Phototrophicaceae bacterium]